MKQSWGWAASDKASAIDAGASQWRKPFVAAAPWLTLGVLVVMMHLVSGSLVAEKGVLFVLPQGELEDGERTSLVALVMQMSRQTLVFFDDARYVLGEPASEEAFLAQLGERSAKLKESTLLVLADRRVETGDLMRLAELARKTGLERMLFAEKRDGGGGEQL